MYYRCPSCGVIPEGPVKDESLNERCPRCGSLVKLEDYDRPFAESTDKQNGFMTTVIGVFLMLGACAILSRCGR